jgi:hypothetical protein
MGQAFVHRRRTENALRAYLDHAGEPQYLNALAAEDPDLAFRYGRLEAQNAENRARQQDAAFTQQVGQQYVSDPQGARNTAIAAGRFDLAKTLNDLGPEKGMKAVDFYKTAAPLAYKMRQMSDPDQRRAFFEQAKPMLLDQGADPATLAAFDPTNDTQLDAFIAQGQSVNDLINQGKITWHQQGEAPSFATDAMGRPVGSANPYRATVPSASPAPAQSTGEFHYDATPGAHETSGYRTPQHNRDVGGVANSFHTRRDANGNPLAHDFVPPAGMSMAEFHADMKRRNPGLDVINEGDHVHIEPSGHVRMASNNAPRAVHSEAEFDALPSGAEFIAPDGTHRRKP